MIKTESRIAEKITLLAIGGGIGALLALLFAPKAGEAFRADIADATRKGLDKTEELANQLNEKARTAYSDTKAMATDLYDAAKVKVDQTTAGLTASSKRIADGIRQESEELFGSANASDDENTTPKAKGFGA